MKNYEEMKNFVKKSNGIITSKEMKEKKISNYYVQKLIDDNILERYSRGFYIRTDIFEDEFYILQQRNSKLVFSYNTALYFLNETERTPENIDVTVYKGYNVHRLSKNVKVHYVLKENLYLGAIETQTPLGFKVMAYNLERTLCDIIKNKDTGMDKEQINKFIQKMLLKNKVDSIVLIEYAKRLKCEKKVREIMDIFM